MFLVFKVNRECTCNECMVFGVKLMLSCLQRKKKCHACLMTQMKSPMSKKAAATPTTPIELASYATHTNTENENPLREKER